MVQEEGRRLAYIKSKSGDPVLQPYTQSRSRRGGWSTYSPRVKGRLAYTQSKSREKTDLHTVQEERGDWPSYTQSKSRREDRTKYSPKVRGDWPTHSQRGRLA
jgi:hypothetical protein